MTNICMFCCYGKLFTFSVAMVKSVAMLKHAVDEKPFCYSALLLWYSLHIPCCYGKIVIKKLCCPDQMFMLCCYGEMLTCHIAVVRNYTDIKLCCNCKRLTLLLW